MSSSSSSSASSSFCVFLPRPERASERASERERELMQHLPTHNPSEGNPLAPLLSPCPPQRSERQIRYWLALARDPLHDGKEAHAGGEAKVERGKRKKAAAGAAGAAGGSGKNKIAQQPRRARG
jgi:hypothetical protein